MNRQIASPRSLLGVAIVVIFSAHTVLAQTETAPKAQPELAAADQGTEALKTDDLFIDWDIINWDWKKDTDQIAKVGLSESQIAQAAQEEDESAAPKSAQCLEFKRDLHADLGDVLRAGCEPTLAQMSALMDNPVGNVAMLFTQIDFTHMENQANGETADKYNYMGIAQFPKGLSADWNLINRVVWNVTSMPIDSDKIDDFGTGPGGEILPPSGSPPAPLDLFDGRTTGFGDMYYVGLFSPKEPIKLEGGANVVWGAGFDLGFPTASDDLLGTGRWTAGPSALGVYLGPKWKLGALVQQYWDFAGDDDRDDVSLTNLQYSGTTAWTQRPPSAPLRTSLPTGSSPAGTSGPSRWVSASTRRFSLARSPCALVSKCTTP